MELYTLSSRFLPKESVGQFTSAIWTERYFSAGDVELVVHAIPSQIDRLSKGTLLGLRGTKEIMMIDTQSVEDGLLKVTGSSISKFLDERQAWFTNPEYDGSDAATRLSAEYTSDTQTAGQLISNAVNALVINPVPYGPPWGSINLDWARDKIAGLQLGVVDGNGAPKRLSLPLGPLYESIQRLAEEEGLGFKLYLESARYTGTYVLKFATYRGKNRTSEQTSNLLIRLSPKLDSLTGVKEINSISNYKNVFYVLYKNEISTHYIPGLPIPTGFDRRSILVEAPDIFLLPEHIAAFREQVARNTIASHVYVKAVDGQISEQIGYTFGTDYYLGDIIELEGFTGLLSKARVTEYIRSEDQFGEKQYPTLSVLDPLFVGYMPDLEPNSDFDPGFDEDPDYDFDPDFDDEDDMDDPEIWPPSKDPRDPPDYNPDPVYDFPPGGTDTDGGGTVPDRMGGRLILDPANENVGFDKASWYEHHDHIYLEGSVYYGVTGDPDGRITIVGGVPEEARPGSNVEFTFYPDMPDSDSIYGNFTTFDGLVTPDGTITVSPVPRTSDSGFELYLLLSNVSWPVNPARIGSPPDTVAQEPLDQWLIQDLPFNDPAGIQPAATSQGAVIGAHGLRAHLGGKATLITPVFGNIIQQLPGKYRSARRDDTLVVPGAGHWWSGYASQGALTLKQQRSKPLIRAANLGDWVHGDEWGPLSSIDPGLSYWGMPIEVWLGSAPEDSIYLQGSWAPPESSDVHTEFGFIIGYGRSALEQTSTLSYKITAEKMDNGQWWQMLTIYYSVLADEGNFGYTRMPMARLDHDGDYFGELPNRTFMNVSIEPLGVGSIQISSTVGGTRYMFEWPQAVYPGEEPFVWPSEIDGPMQWGAIQTLMYGSAEALTPVSNLENIIGDYFIPNNSSFYPPTWLPNYGRVQAGDQFDLNGLGWRV